MGAFAWKVIGTGSAIAAGMVAKNIVQKLWTSATGNPPPANPAARGTSWPEAIGWAVASGAVIGLARMLATRKAADFYERSAGHLPKGLEEVQ